MAQAHSAEQSLYNPGTLKASGTMTGVFGAFIAIGLISFFAMYGADHAHAWSAVLRAHFYFITISLGAMFFIVIQWITTSMWSAPVRRIAEGFTAYIPFILISTLLIFIGSKSLFKWTDLEAIKGDAVVEGKLGYLNMTFFVIRTLIAVAGWIFFQRKLIGGSLSVDQGVSYKTVYERNRKWGVGFLIFFALSFSMAAFDQLMSLDPHFFSTMFGVYTFAGAYQSFFAMLTVVTIILKRTGRLGNLVNENHLHDIGKLMFGFTVFWAYTGFSQYMLIWYANLPEETGYFLLRFNDGWTPWSIGLFIGKFFVPFFLLLPRGNKRSDEVMFITAIWILAMQYLDMNWMIQPQLFPNGPVFAVWDIGVWL
ncbi:MAG: molybdopterin oxidoreductase, partial [Bdellovibrionales bacterium]|nr:molybdopterin oxidoreductase [Oligoflexia bacterium]